MMFTTPEIPESIKSLRCEGYVNVFELNLGNKNLFGTETLYGDWNGDLLLVAKDWGPVSAIDRRIELRKANPADPSYTHPYGHSRESKTNRMIARYLADSEREVSVEDGIGNATCKTLYISACFFLKNDLRASSHLRNGSGPTGWFGKSEQVFDFVLTNMPNLSKIACLGEDAFNFVMRHFKMTAQWRHAFDNRVVSKTDRYGIYALRHPSRHRVTDPEVWRWMLKL